MKAQKFKFRDLQELCLRRNPFGWPGMSTWRSPWLLEQCWGELRLAADLGSPFGTTTGALLSFVDAEELFLALPIVISKILSSFMSMALQKKGTTLYLVTERNSGRHFCHWKTTNFIKEITIIIVMSFSFHLDNCLAIWFSASKDAFNLHKIQFTQNRAVHLVSQWATAFYTNCDWYIQ